MLIPDELAAIVKRNLERDEGRKNAVYFDTKGHPTAGIGHKLLPGDEELVEHGHVTDAVIDCWFREDVQKAFNSLVICGKLDWVSTLTLDRQAALIEMIFNVGITGLVKFKDFLGELKKKDYGEAALDLMASKCGVELTSRYIRYAARILGEGST